MINELKAQYEPNEGLLLKLLGVVRVEPAMCLGDHGFIVIGVTIRLFKDRYDALTVNQIGDIKTWASTRFDISNVNISIEEYK